MYITRIELNTSLKKTMRALVNPNIIHGAISGVITGVNDRPLWRIDNLGGKKYLLVLSINKIDFSNIINQFGIADTLIVKEYDNLLNRIENGSIWRFKLTANPTVKKFDEKRNKSYSLAHITPEYQMKWLNDRAEKNGFKIDNELSMVTESKWISFKKNSSNDSVKLLSVTYEGVLTVTDAECFKKIMTNGIGREKAYGMGLLTVIRCQT